MLSKRTGLFSSVLIRPVAEIPPPPAKKTTHKHTNSHHGSCHDVTYPCITRVQEAGVSESDGPVLYSWPETTPDHLGWCGQGKSYCRWLPLLPWQAILKQSPPSGSIHISPAWKQTHRLNLNLPKQCLPLRRQQSWSISSSWFHLAPPDLVTTHSSTPQNVILSFKHPCGRKTSAGSIMKGGRFCKQCCASARRLLAEDILDSLSDLLSDGGSFLCQDG